MVVVSSYYRGEKSAENEGCLTGLAAVGLEAVAAVVETVMATITVAAGLLSESAASAVLMAAVVVVAAGAVEAAVAPVIIIANRT